MPESHYFIFQLKSDGTIVSPNDWLKKIGCKVEKGQVVLPRDDILVPLSAASRAVEAFNGSTEYTQKLELTLLIGLTVRIAETALFNKLATWFSQISNYLVCSHCIRNSDVFNNLEIKKYRNLCNSKIIHAMENEIMINPEHLIYAIKYYDEVLKLPLFNEIVITSKFEITCCDKCSEKNGILKEYLITSGPLKGSVLTSSDFKKIKPITK